MASTFSQMHSSQHQLLDRERRIRTLGWDCLNVHPEVLTAAIVDTVTSMGCDFETHPPATIVARVPWRATGDELAVIFIVQHSEHDMLCLDIRRLRGDAFGFHAFYREVRQALSHINGWDESRQRYTSKWQIPAEQASPVRRSYTVGNALSTHGDPMPGGACCSEDPSGLPAPAHYAASASDPTVAVAAVRNSDADSQRLTVAAAQSAPCGSDPDGSASE